MKYITVLFLFLFSSTLFAEVIPYVIEREDGGVSVLYYDTGSPYSADEEIKRIGFGSRPYKQISLSDIPVKDENRKYWKVSGKKIVIDEDKKNADLYEKALKEAEKDAVLMKLNITAEEFEKLNAK